MPTCSIVQIMQLMYSLSYALACLASSLLHYIWSYQSLKITTKYMHQYLVILILIIKNELKNKSIIVNVA